MKPIVIVTRRLTSAIFFLIAGIFNIINLLVFDTHINPISLVLEVAWCFTWFVTAIHQLFYRSTIVARIRQDKEAQPFIPAHSLTKATLTTTTAVSAMVMDSYRCIQHPTTSIIMRVCGSAIWVGISGLEVTMARRHEYRAANHPEQTILIGQLKPSIYYALHAFLYLSSGTLYAAALWSNDENAPQHTISELAWIRPIPNLCWLIAGINEVTRTLEITIREHMAPAPISSVKVSEIEEQPVAASHSHSIEMEPTTNHLQ